MELEQCNLSCFNFCIPLQVLSNIYSNEIPMSVLLYASDIKDYSVLQVQYVPQGNEDIPTLIRVIIAHHYSVCTKRDLNVLDTYHAKIRDFQRYSINI